MHEESLETSCVHILKLHTFRVGSLKFPVNLCKYVCICTVADLEFSKGGFQSAIKARVARLLGGSGGMPPRKIL